MASVEEQTRNQIANIESSTGRSLAEWIEIVRASGIEKHAQAVAMLKADHGLGHGNANLIVIKAREAAAGGAKSDEQLVDSHYAARTPRCGRPTTPSSASSAASATTWSWRRRRRMSACAGASSSPRSARRRVQRG